MMNGVSKHIIKEAALDFRYNGHTNGFAFQREVKEWFNEFSQALEQILNSLPEKDEAIFVDELEIEVQLNASDWKEQATEKISRQLQDKLDLLTNGIVQSTGFQKKKQGRKFNDLFLFYLLNGYLSWEISGIPLLQWNEGLQQMIAAADKEYVVRLKNVLQTSSSAVQRFSQSIPFQSAVHLFSVLPKSNSVPQRKFLHDLQLFMKYASANGLNKLKQMGYDVFLQSVCAEADLVNMKDEMLMLLKKKDIAYTRLIEAITSFDFQSELFRQLQIEVKDVVQHKFKQRNKPGAALPGIGKSSDQFAADKMIAGEIYISDAGLVLVAAFLPIFFEKIALSQNNQITDFNKAVCMIRFLATGSERMLEYELPLAKVLCGVDMGTAIDAENFHLDTDMKTEADAVLSSVIEYWSILQNTSVSGLRESFLKRNGKLSYDGKDWLLQVEQQSYDMLIQHLPWNFSMIKLPWMNSLLKTEWVY